MSGWVAASIPVWAGAIFWFAAAFIAPANPKPGETAGDLLVQFLTGLAVSFPLFALAGWLCS